MYSSLPCCRCVVCERYIVLVNPEVFSCILLHFIIHAIICFFNIELLCLMSVLLILGFILQITPAFINLTTILLWKPFVPMDLMF